MLHGTHTANPHVASPHTPHTPHYKPTISRFNAYQLRIDLEAAQSELAEALDKERQAEVEILVDTMIINRKSQDAWDSWESAKYRVYVNNDRKLYNATVRRRLRVEKKIRLIERRLAKFEN